LFKRTIAISSFLITAALVVCLPSATRASDIFHECKSLDDEGVLRLDVEAGVIHRQGNAQPFKYKILEKQRLRELSGYCNTKNGRFRFSTEVYGILVEFYDDQKRYKRRFRCEKSEDATPAGLSCDREVRTIDWQAPVKLIDQYR
jgi:hypothetical protein